MLLYAVSNKFLDFNGYSWHDQVMMILILYAIISVLCFQDTVVLLIRRIRLSSTVEFIDWEGLEHRKLIRRNHVCMSTIIHILMFARFKSIDNIFDLLWLYLLTMLNNWFQMFNDMFNSYDVYQSYMNEIKWPGLKYLRLELIFVTRQGKRDQQTDYLK